MSNEPQASVSIDGIRSAALDADQVTARMELAQFASKVFQEAGQELHLA